MKVLAAAIVALAFAAPAAAAAEADPGRARRDHALDRRLRQPRGQARATRRRPSTWSRRRCGPGMTRKSWARGDIPVYPFPAAGKTHPWNILYVTREEVGLELQLQPRARQQAGADHLPHLPAAGPASAGSSTRSCRSRRSRRSAREEVEGALGPGLLAAGGRRRLARRRRPAPAEQHLARRPVRAGRLRVWSASACWGLVARLPQPAAAGPSRRRAAAASAQRPVASAPWRSSSAGSPTGNRRSSTPR